jgi:hypothetical protein
MIFPDRYMLTEEELAVLAFSIFVSFSRLFALNNERGLLERIWTEYQEVLLEFKQEHLR